MKEFKFKTLDKAPSEATYRAGKQKERTTKSINLMKLVELNCSEDWKPVVSQAISLMEIYKKKLNEL